MSILSKIKDDAILICPPSLQTMILKQKGESYPTLHIKLMDKENLLNGVYFTYEVDALLYIHRKYHYPYDNCKEILDNLRGANFANSKKPKLVLLKQIYDELVEAKKITFTPLFKNMFQDKHIYIYGYSSLDKELLLALHQLDVRYEFVFKTRPTFHHQVTKYPTIEEEVSYLFRHIGCLIKHGVSPNQIYLFKYPSEYQPLIEKYANFHQLKIEPKESEPLYDSPIYKTYVSLLTTNDFICAYNLLKEKIACDNYNATGKLVEILTEILPLDASEIEKKELLTFLAKKKKLETIEYVEQIHLCDAHTMINDDAYVFMVGFSLGEYPKITKDTDFFLDVEKEELGFNTSEDRFSINESLLTDFIHHTNHLTISFKEKNGRVEYYPSLLINKLQMEVHPYTNSTQCYSQKVAKLEVAKAYDLFDNFNIKKPILHTYTKEELEYKTFNHQFQPFSSFCMPDFNLSYTTINAYNKCHFSYFVDKILKVGAFEENFSTKLGILYHKILEETFQKQVLFQDSQTLMDAYQDLFDASFVTYQEKFFAKELLPQVLDVIAFNDQFYQNTMYHTIQTEVKLSTQIDDHTALIGQIDKIMLNDVEKKLIIIDYKTNDFKFKKEKTEVGIDMQLPIYAYLLKQKFDGYHINGLFIQNVCCDPHDKENVNRYKLTGLTINQIDEIKKMDTSLGNKDEAGNRINKSLFIKGCAIRKDGMLSQNKSLVEQSEIEDLSRTAKKQIELAIQNIQEGHFEIAPVKVKGEASYVCDYCKFKDICFVKEEDIFYIDLKEENLDEIE